MASKEVKTTDIYWGAVPFVLIQLVTVALIIAFPKMISVDSKTDMKEQIELNVEMPGSNLNSESPKLEFNLDGDKDGSNDLKLNMGEPDKK